MHSRVSRVPFVTAAIGATILAAGCTATGSSLSAGAKPAVTVPASPRQVLELVAKKSQALTSVAATLSFQSPSTRPDTVTGTFREQLRPSLVEEEDWTEDIPTTHSTAGGGTEIITPEALYLRPPATLQLQGISKPWAEIQLSSPSATRAIISSLSSGVQSENLVAQTQVLATSPDARKVGTRVIDGVPVTEYAGSYFLVAAIAKLPASLASQLQSELRDGITTVQFRIWVNGQDEVRKIVSTEVGTSGMSTGTEIITSIDQPVNIQLPTAAETYVVPASRLGS